MINILLSVRLPWPGLILDGQKTWELRKNAPRIPKGKHVTLWLYESGKDGERAIIGKCRMVSRVPLHYMPAGQGLALLIKDACVTEEHLRNYVPCYAWGVQDPVRLPAAVPLSAIGLTRPPQSWQYLSHEQGDILETYVKTCADCLYWDDFTGDCWNSSSKHYAQDVSGKRSACEFWLEGEIEQEDENETDA